MALMKLSQEDLDAIQSLINPLGKRLSDLESSVAERFDRMDAYFDSLLGRNETFRQEFRVINSQLKRLEARVEDL